MTMPASVESLQRQNAELTRRLDEAEATIQAIQQGAVDAFVVEEVAGHRVYTLESSERPYRLFVEEMLQGVATLTESGVISWCNRRLAELLGLPQDRLAGSDLAEFIVAGDRADYLHALREGPGRSRGGEFHIQHADGRVIPVHITLNPLPVDSESWVGAFVTDLTAQKDREALLAAQAALREADQRKNEFLAMLAHELRNPLAPIRNAVDILRLTGGEATAVRRTSEMLERQVGLMVRLVDDLLDVSRVSRGRIELRRERTALAPIIGYAVEATRPLFAAKGVELGVVLPDAPVYLHADPARLTQVVGNLLSNACKFTPQAGTVSLSVKRERSQVTISVRDSGVGIPAQDLDRVFEMFAQVDTSLERASGGLGIGLTLVKSLVEMHGGRVEARSEGPGRGSEFLVHLPVLIGSSTPAGNTAPGDTTSATYRILVVDDGRDAAESLALLLKLHGHEVHIAHDGVAAVDAAEAFRPDVVLLDIGMPRLNGYEACKRIRAAPWGKNMVLLAQTGWGQEEDRRLTEEAGFDAHLVKPVDYNALLRLIASLAPTGS
jgi:PAS domain S-box-containing protein